MKRKVILSLALFVFLLAGCTTVIPEMSWHPWMSTYYSDEKVITNSSFEVEVTPNHVLSLGDISIKSEKMKNCIIDQLKRKGYSYNKDNFKYKIKVTYSTDRFEKQSISMEQKSQNASVNIFERSRYSAIGILFAGLLTSSSSISSNIQTTKLYSHSISIDIYSNDKIIWKSESSWDSENIDIDFEALMVTRLLLSNLPVGQISIPKVAEVKETHSSNYFNINCADRWFSCPALPNKIYFDYNPLHKYHGIYSFPSGILNPYALEAYIDCIETSEFALPLGKNTYDNPLDISLWSKVILGGKYYLGNSTKPINVLITMDVDRHGYIIDKCKIISDEEYDNFNSKLDVWKKALSDFYDVYKNN